MIIYSRDIETTWLQYLKKVMYLFFGEKGEDEDHPYKGNAF